MALVFDFDSTLVRDESLVELLKSSLKAQVNRKESCDDQTDSSSISQERMRELVSEIESITNLGITNQISMLESYNRRLHIAKPTAQDIQSYVASCHEIETPGMRQLIDQVRRLFPQVQIRVVSQGPRCIVQPIVHRLFGIESHHVHRVNLDTVSMQVSSSDEMLIGGKSKMVQKSLSSQQGAENLFPIIMIVMVYPI